MLGEVYLKSSEVELSETGGSLPAQKHWGFPNTGITWKHSTNTPAASEIIFARGLHAFFLSFF